MQATIDRNIDYALSQSESISQTQQRAQVQIGSDEFLDIVLNLKNMLIKATDGYSTLNNGLIVDYNTDSKGVVGLLPKLEQLLQESEELVQNLSDGFAASCLGTTVINNFKLEVSQLSETITDIERKRTQPSSSLQALYDQL